LVDFRIFVERTPGNQNPIEDLAFIKDGFILTRPETQADKQNNGKQELFQRYRWLLGFIANFNKEKKFKINKNFNSSFVMID